MCLEKAVKSNYGDEKLSLILERIELLAGNYSEERCGFITWCVSGPFEI